MKANELPKADGVSFSQKMGQAREYWNSNVSNELPELLINRQNEVVEIIESFFDVVLISERENLRKPDPEIFQLALDKLGVLPHESIFVGDRPINDVQSARNVGMIGVWKKDSQWNQIETDYRIEDLSELIGIVRELNKK